MVQKPFQILSSPYSSWKGHGPKGSWVTVRLLLAGGFVYPAGERKLMPDQRPDDTLAAIVTATELSLALVGLWYYYNVQLPEQRRKLQARSSRSHAKTL